MRISLTPNGLANQYYGLIPQFLLPCLGRVELTYESSVTKTSKSAKAMDGGLLTALLRGMCNIITFFIKVLNKHKIHCVYAE